MSNLIASYPYFDLIFVFIILLYFIFVLAI